jgi:hypothetical protein
MPQHDCPTFCPTHDTRCINIFLPYTSWNCEVLSECMERPQMATDNCACCNTDRSQPPCIDLTIIAWVFTLPIDIIVAIPRAFYYLTTEKPPPIQQT